MVDGKQDREEQPESQGRKEKAKLLRNIPNTQQVGKRGHGGGVSEAAREPGRVPAAEERVSERTVSTAPPATGGESQIWILDNRMRCTPTEGKFQHRDELGSQTQWVLKRGKLMRCLSASCLTCTRLCAHV